MSEPSGQLCRPGFFLRKFSLMKIMELSARLECVLSFVRKGSKIYDIGSDHGYLPIALLSRGICARAVVTDINKGPYQRTVRAMEYSNLIRYVNFYLANGLIGLPFDKDVLSDVAICGMGGELISTILNDRPDVRELDLNYILQPMTKPEALRRYLWENGYEIRAEKAVCEEDKSYVVINAVYTGVKTEFTEAELYLGKRDAVEISRDADVLYGRLIATFEKKRDAFIRAELPVDFLDKIIDELNAEASLREVKK